MPSNQGQNKKSLHIHKTKSQFSSESAGVAQMAGRSSSGGGGISGHSPPAGLAEAFNPYMRDDSSWSEFY